MDRPRVTRMLSKSFNTSKGTVCYISSPEITLGAQQTPLCEEDNCTIHPWRGQQKALPHESLERHHKEQSNFSWTASHVCKMQGPEAGDPRGELVQSFSQWDGLRRER